MSKLCLSLLVLLVPALARAGDSAPLIEPGPAGFWLGAHVVLNSSFERTTEGAGTGAGRLTYTDGAGVGARLGYDAFGYVGPFLEADFNVEDEGPFTAYGGGLRALTPLLGKRVRLGGAVGLRFIDIGVHAPFVTLGATGEVLVTRWLGLAAEVDKALPLGSDYERDAGAGITERITAESGPLRGGLSLKLYFGG